MVANNKTATFPTTYTECAGLVWLSVSWFGRRRSAAWWNGIKSGLAGIAKLRPRLFISIAIGVAVIAALMLLTDWRAASALLVGWNVCTGLYLALGVHLMAKAGVHQMRLQARLQDEGRFAILLLTAVAALTSLAATLHPLAVYLLTPRKLSIEPSGWSRKLRTGSGLILFIEALAGPMDRTCHQNHRDREPGLAVALHR